MPQQLPLYIPTFISSVDYKPSRVLPHLYFYNGKVQCEPFYIEHKGTGPYANLIFPETSSAFPYVDNYSVTGSNTFPSTNSKSLLFNNESAPYGTTPTASLYTEYYQKYVELLYNPKTRLFNVSGIIPFADYNELTLNDIVEWRGNYYHLRAINDYSVKTGECNLQLLGPIIFDTFGTIPTPPQTFGAVSWSYTEARQDGEFILKDNGTIIADLTASIQSGSQYGSASISSSHIISASLTPVNYPNSSSVTMSLIVNGPNPTSQTAYNQNITLSTQFTVTSGSLYSITASIQYNSSSIVSGTLQQTWRYGFANTTNTNDICLVNTSSAWEIPPSPFYSPSTYVFQNDQGTSAFPYKYIIDRYYGFAVPAAYYNYNSGSGQVGSYVGSCL